VLPAVFLIGCGSDQPMGEVTGTVTYNGQPVPSGSIVFEVADARPANAKIENGEIKEVTTYEPGDGAPVGLARIAVFATEEGNGQPDAAPAADPGSYQPGANYMGSGTESLIPARYNDPATSGLTWEIEEGKNEITLELSD
jgi:hypothetical protein